jgi:hypothetical protein
MRRNKLIFEGDRRSIPQSSEPFVTPKRYPAARCTSSRSMTLSTDELRALDPREPTNGDARDGKRKPATSLVRSATAAMKARIRIFLLAGSISREVHVKQKNRRVHISVGFCCFDLSHRSQHRKHNKQDQPKTKSPRGLHPSARACVSSQEGELVAAPAHLRQLIEDQ